MNDHDRTGYLTGLMAGADVDHRGTPFTEALLDELLNALRDPETSHPRLGAANFDEATFSGEARFYNTLFSGEAIFWRTRFTGPAGFSGAQFAEEAKFGSAIFADHARFTAVSFEGDATFGGAHFQSLAFFGRSSIKCAFWLIRTTFDIDVHFEQASFDGVQRLGPMKCAGLVDLDRARFGMPVTIEVVADRVQCRRTRWDSTAALRLRYASVDLTDAVWEYPTAVSAHPAEFKVESGFRIEPMGEAPLAGRHPGVRIISLSGVDAAHLSIANVDLVDCLFVGTAHLDQLRMEGRCVFASVPSGICWRGWWPTRWTPRRTVAEEQHWRAAQDVGCAGWSSAPEGVHALEPAALAPLYRQLRKAFEDGKDEPGAADFYYGEMEMRRHDRETPRGERFLITVYWALSGYGLRASRALSWLLAAMTVTMLAMMLWGLPHDDPKSESTGTLTGRSITMTTETPDPVNPKGPYRERFSSKRFETSLRVVVNSVIFRNSGQNLTTAGTYTEMASRLAEPVLLGLAVLAIRGRVKR
ncbi:pentapeptide repeat-containing protein [Streptomyces sp. NPDC005969]|uniref:pentapeptide repeat-containing protein n=1 Tax=Streptomyces sp. NPDC005969 TaxID=3156722 RepID=UPI0033EEC8AD